MESEKSESGNKIAAERRVGLLFDERMCKHENTRDDSHPETPYRIRAIWNKLQTTGIIDRCVILDAKEAEDKYILSVHSQNHVNLIKNISSNSRRLKIASKLNSIYFNEGSSEAAYLAAGSAIDVVERVASRDLHSAVAVVRPPGHHAEHGEAMGFCLFNNVAIAASYLLNERPDLGVKKILIVDWDVHHGNGTQKMFWNDSQVLFFSVHRHEFGSFYPANDDGFYTMVGEGAGAGYTINVPWENGRCGDADYFAVWDHILLPVAKEFNPDMVIVSAGFDAAIGDPLGGCRVTPFGYSVMLKKLMDFAEGRVALVLEGGYNLDSIAKSMHACVEVLLENCPIIGSSEAYPFESTWRVIQAVRQRLSPFWPTLASELPEKLISRMAPPPHTLISSSDSETEDDKVRPNSELEELLQDVIRPLSELKVGAGTMSSATVLDAIQVACLKQKKKKNIHSNTSGQTSGAPGSKSGSVATPAPEPISSGKRKRPLLDEGVDLQPEVQLESRSKRKHDPSSSLSPFDKDYDFLGMIDREIHNPATSSQLSQAEDYRIFLQWGEKVLTKTIAVLRHAEPLVLLGQQTQVEVKSLRESLDLKNKENDSLKARLKELEEQLKTSLEQLKISKKKREEKERELGLLQEELKKAKRRSGELEQELDDLRLSSTHTISRLESEVEAMEVTLANSSLDVVKLIKDQVRVLVPDLDLSQVGLFTQIVDWKLVVVDPNSPEDAPISPTEDADASTDDIVVALEV